VIATPLARREARRRGINISTVKGSGPRGRVKQKDVLEAGGETPDAAVTEHLPGAGSPTPFSPPVAPSLWRRTVAERMVQSKTTIPHFYVSTEVDCAALEAAIGMLRHAAPDRRVTVTHLMLLAIGRALRALPEANRIWSNGNYQAIGSANVGLAVDTPKGLAAPVVENCDASLWDVAERALCVVERARRDQLQAGDFATPAAISLSNAGMHEVTQMISIIPPGQTSILGVGSIRPVFRPDDNGLPAARREMTFSLSCDHRVLDGVAAIRLLNTIKQTMTNPLPELLAPAWT